MTNLAVCLVLYIIPGSCLTMQQQDKVIMGVKSKGTHTQIITERLANGSQKEGTKINHTKPTQETLGFRAQVKVSATDTKNGSTISNLQDWYVHPTRATPNVSSMLAEVRSAASSVLKVPKGGKDVIAIAGILIAVLLAGMAFVFLCVVVIRSNSGHQQLKDEKFTIKVSELKRPEVTWSRQETNVCSQVFEIQSSERVTNSFKWMGRQALGKLRTPFGQQASAKGAELLQLQGPGLDEHARYYCKHGGSADIKPTPWTAAVVTKVLKERGVVTTCWPRSLLSQLVAELKSSAAFIAMGADGTPKIIVEHVMVIIHNPDTGKVLVPDKVALQKLRGTNVSSTLKRLQKDKRDIAHMEDMGINMPKKFGERVEKTAKRFIKERLGLPDGVVEIDMSSEVKTLTACEETSNYPGLTSIVDKHLIQACVVSKDEKKLKLIGADQVNRVKTPASALSGANVEKGFETIGDDGKTYMWIWKHPSSVPEIHKHHNFLRSMSSTTSSTGSTAKSQSSGGTRFVSTQSQSSAPMVLQSVPSLHTGTTTLQRRSLDKALAAVMPWDEGAVQKCLADALTSSGDLGMTVQQISMYACQRVLSFAFREDEGFLAIFDYLSLRIFEPGGRAMLIQTADEDSSGQNSADESEEYDATAVDNPELGPEESSEFLKFPEVQWRIDESSWDAAQRLASSILGLDMDALVIDSDLRELRESEERFAPRTVKRKWVLSAKLRENDVAECLVKETPFAWKT